MVDKTVLHTLASGMVLDKSVLVTLPSPELAHVISSIRAAGGKPLYVIDGAETFFTPATLVSLIAAKDLRYQVCNEALGGFFTEAQITALTEHKIGQPLVIKPAAVVDAGLIVDLGAQPAAVGNYTFAQVPAGWTLSGNMSLGPTKIKRKIKNADGDGMLFAMTPQDYEKLWLFASKAWAGLDVPLVGTFNTYTGKLKATVQDDRVSLGGNYVRRYELEQVAKYRGWAMPELQAA